MIDLNDENDPFLFSVTLASGKLVVQYMETLAALQESLPQNSQPTTANIVETVRKTARTREVAANAQDWEITAAWLRMTKAMETAGNV
jgi:hypothetical protein